MSTLVTGGTGFLGVNLVRLLVRDDRSVRVLVRSNSSRLGLDAKHVEFVRGDVTDAESVRQAMRGCDEVYHLAAWVQISPWGLKTARRVNVEGTRNVCAAALELGVRRMIHTSSIATVAAGTLDAPADENAPLDDEQRRIPYHRTKIEAENVVGDFVRRGLDAVIVNPAYLVGPWDVKPSAGRLLIRAATGGVPCYPKKGGINYVDVREAATGHLLAMKHGRTGERYSLGGENLPHRTYLHRVASIVGISPARLAIPRAAIYPFAAAGSLAGRLFPRLFRDANLSVLKSAYVEHYVSSDKASRELGYEIKSIDGAIEDGINWFVAHGYMKAPSGSFLWTAQA